MTKAATVYNDLEQVSDWSFPSVAFCPRAVEVSPANVSPLVGFTDRRCFSGRWRDTKEISLPHITVRYHVGTPLAWNSPFSFSDVDVSIVRVF